MCCGHFCFLYILVRSARVQFPIYWTKSVCVCVCVCVWSVSGCEFVTAAVTPLGVRDPLHAPVARMCSRAPKESWVTSQTLSAMCKAESGPVLDDLLSRLPSVWPASMAWTCVSRRLARRVRRKLSGRSCHVPEEMRWCTVANFLVQMELSHALFAWGGQSAHQCCLSQSLGSCAGDVIISSTSAACCWWSWDTTYLNFVLWRMTAANSNCSLACANQRGVGRVRRVAVVQPLCTL